MKDEFRDRFDLHIAFLIFWAYLWGAFRFVQVKYTKHKNITFDSDAIEVWRPFARKVLDGAIPYTPEVWDNKPPFFQALNIIAEFTGHYYIVMIAFVATANAIIAYIIYRIWVEEEGKYLGLLAGVLFLSALSYIGNNIQPRTFAILFILLAMFWRGLGGFARGTLTATGALFSQHVIFAAPLILWIVIQKSEKNLWPKMAQFTLGGIFTVVIAYGSLAVIYSFNTMIRALYYTNGITTNYFTRDAGRHILAVPIKWLFAFLGALDNQAFLIISAVYGSYIVLSNKKADVQSFIKYIKSTKVKKRVDEILLLLLVSLIPALLLRATAEYWIFFFPSLSGIAAVGIKSLILQKQN
jgi:hypothetical protein